MRFYSIVDIGFVIFIIWLITRILQSFSYEFDRESFESYITHERYISVLCQLCLYMKFTYFVSLVDKIAPFIDIISQIFYDIRHFGMVLMVIIFALAQCFKIIGQSQLDFDEISELEFKTIGILYETTPSSFEYVASIIYGGCSTKPFYLGKASQ